MTDKQPANNLAEQVIMRLSADIRGGRLAPGLRDRVPRAGLRGRGAAAGLHALAQRTAGRARARGLRRAAGPLSVRREPWGASRAGEALELFTPERGRILARVATFGATLVSLELLRGGGRRTDVVLGVDSLAG